MVETYLATPSDRQEQAWRTFERRYMNLLEKRFRENRESFDVVAELAQHENVFIGCSCPTTRNPEPSRCHTILALRFMKRKYLKLVVVFPPGVDEDEGN